MKKLFFSLAALTVLTLAFAPQTEAAPKSGHFTTSHSSGMSHQDHSNSHGNYHLTHGQKFSHGYFYQGRNHNHWTSSRWDSRYGCQCYYDSGCCSWYYWCQPYNCYYPVSYCPCQTYCFSPPVASAPAPCPTCVPVTVTVQVCPPIPAPCSTYR